MKKLNCNVKQKIKKYRQTRCNGRDNKKAVQLYFQCGPSKKFDFVFRERGKADVNQQKHTKN